MTILLAPLRASSTTVLNGRVTQSPMHGHQHRLGALSSLRRRGHNDLLNAFDELLMSPIRAPADVHLCGEPWGLDLDIHRIDNFTSCQ